MKCTGFLGERTCVLVKHYCAKWTWAESPGGAGYLQLRYLQPLVNHTKPPCLEVHRQSSQHPGKPRVSRPVAHGHDNVCLHECIERINSFKTLDPSLVLWVISVFSKYCCLSVKLRILGKPSEERAPSEWLVRPPLAFYTWRLLQALLCLPFLAPESLVPGWELLVAGFLFKEETCSSALFVCCLPAVRGGELDLHAEAVAYR